MQLVIPESILPELVQRVNQIAPRCSVVPISSNGVVQGDTGDDEVLMLRWWGLSKAGFQRAVKEIPNLRWIHTISAGVNHVLFPYLIDSDIVLTNAAGVYDVSVAEMVLAYMLTIVKRLPEFREQQLAHCWNETTVGELRGLTLGVVGLGSLGTQVARLAQAFGMRVVATKRRPKQGGELADLLLPPDQLHDLLVQSDFVVLSVPLLEETRHLIDAQALAQMKPDAWLINVARGAVVDEHALATALREGKIGGAGLDVFQEEPLPEDSPLWDLPNTLITPHNSGLSNRLYQRSADLFLENLRRYVTGEPLLNVVDKKAGY